MKRREFIRYATGLSVGSLFGLVGCSPAQQGVSKRPRPNVVFLFADQWRGQDTGFAGNADVITPNLDRLAAGASILPTRFQAVRCALRIAGA